MPIQGRLLYYPGGQPHLTIYHKIACHTIQVRGYCNFLFQRVRHNIVLTLETLPEELAGQIISAIALLLCFC